MEIYKLKEKTWTQWIVERLFPEAVLEIQRAVHLQYKDYVPGPEKKLIIKRYARLKLPIRDELETYEEEGQL